MFYIFLKLTQKKPKNEIHGKFFLKSEASSKKHHHPKNPPFFFQQIVCLALIATCVVARPQEPEVELLKFENNIEGENYNFAYEQSDQQKRAETGTFEAGAEPEQGVLSVVGDYSYVLPNGKTVTVTYTADDKGFRPKFTIA